MVGEYGERDGKEGEANQHIWSLLRMWEVLASRPLARRKVKRAAKVLFEDDVGHVIKSTMNVWTLPDAWW